MSELITTPQYDNNHYAVVDLGSNSFHLLVVRLVGNNIETVNKLKRKVRLAAGLNEHNQLSADAITSGLDCLSLFANQLASIAIENIRIVATATLRIATNSDVFISQANRILPINITLLGGTEEANTIYSGLAHTCPEDSQAKRLALDIGGASTELIIGEGYQALHAISLNLGCVSFNSRYFADGNLSAQNFSAAIAAAQTMITPVAKDFIKLGWQSVLGGSGTMQALAEILIMRQQAPMITPAFLQEIQQELILTKKVEAISFAGLREDRAAVLASGLSILIALFDALKITGLTLSKGALREGLLFEMLPEIPGKYRLLGE